MNPFESSTRNKSVVHSLLRESGEGLRKLKREEILNDEESLRSVLDSTGDRLRAFEDAVALYQQLPSGRPVRVLVDFDVLFTLMEIENARRRDALFVHYFFRGSSLKYGIPAGAFHELLNYLDKELGGHGALQMGELSTRNPLDCLAMVLDIDVADLKRPVSRQRIEDRLDVPIARLARLLDAITDDRCGGVYSDYNGSTAKQMETVLQGRERYSYPN